MSPSKLVLVAAVFILADVVEAKDSVRIHVTVDVEQEEVLIGDVFFIAVRIKNMDRFDVSFPSPTPNLNLNVTSSTHEGKEHSRGLIVANVPGTTHLPEIHKLRGGAELVVPLMLRVLQGSPSETSEHLKDRRFVENEDGVLVFKDHPTITVPISFAVDVGLDPYKVLDTDPSERPSNVEVQRRTFGLAVLVPAGRLVGDRKKLFYGMPQGNSPLEKIHGTDQFVRNDNNWRDGLLTGDGFPIDVQEWADVRPILSRESNLVRLLDFSEEYLRLFKQHADSDETLIDALDEFFKRMRPFEGRWTMERVKRHLQRHRSSAFDIFVNRFDPAFLN